MIVATIINSSSRLVARRVCEMTTSAQSCVVCEYLWLDAGSSDFFFLARYHIQVYEAQIIEKKIEKLTRRHRVRRKRWCKVLVCTINLIQCQPMTRARQMIHSTRSIIWRDWDLQTDQMVDKVFHLLQVSLIIIISVTYVSCGDCNSCNEEYESDKKNYGEDCCVIAKYYYCLLRHCSDDLIRYANLFDKPCKKIINDYPQFECRIFFVYMNPKFVKAGMIIGIIIICLIALDLLTKSACIFYLWDRASRESLWESFATH